MTKFDYSKEDIILALKDVGIKNGDNIFIHSNLGFFGILKNANKKENYWTIFKDAIFQVIGIEGTLIVPTFSYSFCWQHDFDVNKTPSTVGMFSELVRNDLESLRSEDANFSISAMGKNAKYFTENAPIHSFGKNSFWEKLVELDGKICNFNVGLLYNTFIHYAEKLFEVPYRYDKSFTGKFINNPFIKIRKNIHFVRDLSDPNTLPDLKRLCEIAYDFKKGIDIKLGKGQISCISAKDTLSIIERELKKDPSFLINGNKENLKKYYNKQSN
jgi:aminoglycoside 3-N-acetyltransferase